MSISYRNNGDLSSSFVFPDFSTVKVQFHSKEDQEKVHKYFDQLEQFVLSLDKFVYSKKIEKDEINPLYLMMKAVIGTNSDPLVDVLDKSYFENDSPTWEEIEQAGKGDGCSEEEFRLYKQKTNTPIKKFNTKLIRYIYDLSKKFYQFLEDCNYSALDIWNFTHGIDVQDAIHDSPDFVDAENHYCAQCSICSKFFSGAVPGSSKDSTPMNRKQGYGCSSFVHMKTLQDIKDMYEQSKRAVERIKADIDSSEKDQDEIDDDDDEDKGAYSYSEQGRKERDLAKYLNELKKLSELIQYMQQGHNSVYLICGAYGSTNFDYSYAFFKNYDRYSVSDHCVICDWCIYKLYLDSDIDVYMYD